jgi:hypothetical protein
LLFTILKTDSDIEIQAKLIPNVGDIIENYFKL